MSPLSLTVSLPPPHLPRVSCCCQAPCRRSVLFWVKVLRADTPVSETWLAQCLVPGEACACHGGRLSVGLPSSVWALQAPALECRLLWGAARLCSPHLDAAASGGGGRRPSRVHMPGGLLAVTGPSSLSVLSTTATRAFVQPSPR